MTSRHSWETRGPCIRMHCILLRLAFVQARKAWYHIRRAQVRVECPPRCWGLLAGNLCSPNTPRTFVLLLLLATRIPFLVLVVLLHLVLFEPSGLRGSRLAFGRRQVGPASKIAKRCIL